MVLGFLGFILSFSFFSDAAHASREKARSEYNQKVQAQRKEEITELRCGWCHDVDSNELEAWQSCTSCKTPMHVSCVKENKGCFVCRPQKNQNRQDGVDRPVVLIEGLNHRNPEIRAQSALMLLERNEQDLWAREVLDEVYKFGTISSESKTRARAFYARRGTTDPDLLKALLLDGSIEILYLEVCQEQARAILDDLFVRNQLPTPIQAIAIRHYNRAGTKNPEVIETLINLVKKDNEQALLPFYNSVSVALAENPKEAFELLWDRIPKEKRLAFVSINSKTAAQIESPSYLAVLGKNFRSDPALAFESALKALGEQPNFQPISEKEKEIWFKCILGLIENNEARFTMFSSMPKDDLDKFYDQDVSTGVRKSLGVNPAWDLATKLVTNSVTKIADSSDTEFLEQLLEIVLVSKWPQTKERGIAFFKDLDFFPDRLREKLIFLAREKDLSQDLIQFVIDQLTLENKKSSAEAYFNLRQLLNSKCSAMAAEAARAMYSIEPRLDVFDSETLVNLYGHSTLEQKEKSAILSHVSENYKKIRQSSHDLETKLLRHLTKDLTNVFILQYEKDAFAQKWLDSELPKILEITAGASTDNIETGYLETNLLFLLAYSSENELIAIKRLLLTFFLYCPPRTQAGQNYLINVLLSKIAYFRPFDLGNFSNYDLSISTSPATNYNVFGRILERTKLNRLLQLRIQQEYVIRRPPRLKGIQILTKTKNLESFIQLELVNRIDPDWSVILPFSSIKAQAQILLETQTPLCPEARQKLEEIAKLKLRFRRAALAKKILKKDDALRCSENLKSKN